MFKTKILLLPLNPDRDSSCHGTWRSSHGREIKTAESLFLQYCNYGQSKGFDIIS
jgi:hypothetical protein